MSYFICEPCKLAFTTIKGLHGHYFGMHKDEPRPTKEQCEVEELPEGYTLVEPKAAKPKAEEVIEERVIPPGGKDIYRQMPEPSNILRRILSSFPGLPEGVVDEIMSWVEYKVVLHPMEVSHLLSQMAGVPKGAANIISQKYQLAMQKAAQEGNADIQMTIAGWSQMGQQQQIGTVFPMMGQPGGQYQQVSPWGQPQTGYPYQPPYPQGYTPQGYYPYQPPQPPSREKESPETDERFNQMEARFDKLYGMFDIIRQEAVEREEHKKEDALNARLGKIEEAITVFLSQPRIEEGTSKADERLKELRDELVAMRNEIATNRITGLEEKISLLGKQLTESSQDRISRLETELAETKRLASQPVTGRTEMDLIGDLGKEGLGAIKEAGKDIKSFAMSGHTQERFNPERKPVKERKKQGEKLAEKVEGEAELTEEEGRYVTS